MSMLAKRDATRTSRKKRVTHNSINTPPSPNNWIPDNNWTLPLPGFANTPQGRDGRSHAKCTRHEGALGECAQVEAHVVVVDVDEQ